MSSRNCNCNNMGSSCGGCGRGNGVIATMQQGDTFPVYLAYKDDDVLSALENGWNIIAAFYNYKGELICEKRTARGEITVNEDGVYVFKVTHDESVKMLGKVGVELTLTEVPTTIHDQKDRNVYHGDKIVSVAFEPRMNNNLV